MSTILWKYARPLSRETLEETQAKLGVLFPASYVDCVLRNNGGRPVPSCFDFPGRPGAVFHRLLPVGGDDTSGIQATLDALSGRIPAGHIPFAADPFGNYLCFRYPGGNDAPVFFWDHEAPPNAAPAHVCDGFDALLRSLY